MVTLLGAAAIRARAAELGLRPTKSRGQNFVIDANTVRRIVTRSEVAPHDVVLEVGPGLGSLTLALLEVAAEVIAVEVDPVLAEALPETIQRYAPQQADRVVAIHADALALPHLPTAPTALIANLPYNVAVPVLLESLGHYGSLSHGVVMVQKEVAERLCAAPGSKVYGAPSVKLAWYADAAYAGDVSAKVFWPEPRIASGLVSFRRRGEQYPEDVRRIAFAAIDAAFGQRRKSVRAALSNWAGSAQRAEQWLREAEIDPGARGETLSANDFHRLALVAKNSR